MSDQPIPLFEPADKNEVAKESFKQFAFETLKIIIISLIIILPVRYYLVQPFYVKGQSMEPNFHDNEYLIINEIGYRLNLPERGDIIVFKYPKNPSEFYIKRIIGLPGETIKIKDNQIIIFNAENPGGKILDENAYLASGTETAGNLSVTLNDNEYYVLGDNRASSKDSRYFGPVDKKYIIGRTWLRGWPFDRIKVF
ncbi:signal peptidase I [Candidatus Kuenenbacteria bacterium CG10_big_fil_rev_8_21_14_0_10_36_11]|uniref:Signal peptidase I n=1 Tax=Candidatus Kuenenbacteria bacterium CG10_big_fil_rev_8_21_14_0_10_36_11 TaxID=1974618 RepID=A0A2M6WB86_9BACT|nr:MAG: signal peptidase I [Candidatus Kuenenbacteria bacterium CG10_big_fil_rev_8_21_14_0_10_36_11]